MEAVLDGEEVFLTNRKERWSSLSPRKRPRHPAALEDLERKDSSIFWLGFSGEDRKSKRRSKLSTRRSPSEGVARYKRLLQWMAGTPLPRSVERLLKNRRHRCLLSVVTGWEIILKPKLGIRVIDIEAALGEMGAVLLSIKFKHLHVLANLPVLHDHRDPFDRMLVAQAIAEELPIVTSDHRFADYKGVRILWDS